MEHYICKGTCKGVSEKPGNCSDKSCPLFGESLEYCDCTDDKHYGRQDAHIHDDEEDLGL